MGSPDHPSPADGTELKYSKSKSASESGNSSKTHLNSGPTVSADEVSLLAVVNHGGAGELLVADLNKSILKRGKGGKG